VSDPDKLVAMLSQAMHLIWTDESDMMHGFDDEVHHHKHIVWMYALATGIQFATQYPGLAVRTANLWKRSKAVENTLPVTDALAGMLSTMWPTAPSPDKLLEVANTPRDAAVLPLMLRFEKDGTPKWDVLQKNQRVFPDWHEEYETWENGA